MIPNPPMEMEGEQGGVSKTVALVACTAMALFYVAILYAPTLVLRLPPPVSLKFFLIRRFICAAVSTLVSLLVCALILPIRDMDASRLLGVYGIRLDHIWQAVAFPLCLTSLMYTGSMALKFLTLVDSWNERRDLNGNLSFNCFGSVAQELFSWISSLVSNPLWWRNCVVAPLTEELVFRACMIPLLLCGGFRTYNIVFLCPIFFSLAHLNHLMELCIQKKHTLVQALMIVGLQLGYTVIFGWYASFLFIRSGNILAPLVAHIFCNYMGLPVLFSKSKGIVTSVAFVAGTLSFLWLLFPITNPNLYNARRNDCKCWHGYCSWN